MRTRTLPPRPTVCATHKTSRSEHCRRRLLFPSIRFIIQHPTMRPALRLLAGASSRAPARTVTRLTPQQAAAAREAARLATLRNPPSPTPSTTAPSTAAAAAAGDTDQLPPGSRPVATPRPGGPQTDRRKSLVDSFRSECCSPSLCVAWSLRASLRRRLSRILPPPSLDCRWPLVHGCKPPRGKNLSLAKR